MITKHRKAITKVLALLIGIPLMTQAAFAAGFSGKVGSTYTAHDGGRITYGSGDGGYSNSRTCDLGDDLGSRYSYCVQPAKASPATGTVTVDKVLTDDDDQGKWNALRNIVYYSPSYPGYDQNVKNIRGTYYTGNFSKDWGIAHMALSYVYAGRPSDMDTWGGTSASDLGEVWTKAKKLGDALWSDNSAKDDAVPDSFKVFIAYMSGVQDMIVGYLESPGYLEMTKSSNNTKVTDLNACYSLEGAEYTVYDSANKAVGKLTVKKDGKSNVLELPEGTYTVKETKAPEGYALNKDTKTVILVDEVAYEGLYTDQWYVLEGTLMVKETGDPLIENGKEITVVSEPFKPLDTNGKQKITFEINTAGLEGKELVAFETCYRLDGYKKGDDVTKAKKTKVGEHKDINDKGQTVKIVKPEEPVVPETPRDTPETGDSNLFKLFAALFIIAALGITALAGKEAHRKLKERREDREFFG